MKKDKIKVECETCHKEEYVIPSRAKGYKTCSKSCQGKYSQNILSKKVIKNCPVCGTEFEVKLSQFKRRNYCSKKCQAKDYITRYEGKNNPNFRNKVVNRDGYKVGFRNNRILNLHVAVVYEYLNIDNHKGYNIHHRDCNMHNNTLENLVLLTSSEHRWLHKQYGNATLWAFMNNKIDIDSLIEWSNDKEKAKYLLNLSVLNQNTAVLKFRELGETPEVDNTEPSLRSDSFEGVTTSSESFNKDNNSTKSAEHGIFHEDIV